VEAYDSSIYNEFILILTYNILLSSIAFFVYFRKQITNTWKVLICGAGEGWSRTDHVKNEDVLHRVKEERKILCTIKRRMANWIGNILCRNRLLKHVIEGQIRGKDRSDGNMRTKL
jgi:hypothetical protein